MHVSVCGPGHPIHIQHRAYVHAAFRAPRTPVSFFREIRLISYFDSNITLMARHAHRAREAIDLPL